MERRRQTFLYLSSLICIWSVLAEQKLYGLHSDELNFGQLVVPHKVDSQGEYLSHQLSHHHQQDYKQLKRSKRSPSDSVHYRLNVDNVTLHLELEPHSYFMTPNLIVERHRRELRTRKRPNKNTNCHFHGKVRGHTDSSVAISACNGLVGHIRTKHNEYYIEPSKLHDAHPTDGHPHVVFQRSSVKEKHQKQQQQQQQQHNKTKRKYRKRKQHNKPQHEQQPQQLQQQQQRKQHKRAVSNCGTKEPRRRTETRLEWQPQGKVKIQGGRKIRRHHHNHYKQQQQQAQQHQPQQRHQHQQQLHKPQTKFKYQTTTNTTTKSTQSTTNSIHAKNISPSPSPSPSSSSTHSNATMATATDSIHARRKRSISSARHVEALIVADATMVAFHSNVEEYLLTIMNMVSALYKDPTIGNSIEIVVVKIILLEEEDAAQPELNLTLNAQQNLDTFCSWQHKLNTINEKDPNHHDVAILVTRKNICGNNCMTLGLANVGGMCKPKQSCSVNEDNGILLSHTIAHELGHNFGMFHDTAKIGCHPRVGSIVHIMTPTFGADTLQVSWSNCSRKYITHFLDQGHGGCLDNAPQPIKYNYPTLLPGAMFNAELQCRLQFNVSDSSSVGTCSSMNEICSTLWCEVNGECVTNMRPTAPGTSCGKRKWCQNGKCVRMEEITPVNGGWGNWSDWNECSRGCGGGVSIQKRECNNPVPANGGLFCIGERKRYKICNTEACSDGEPSFRGKQCSRFDNTTYQGTLYKWLPFFDKKHPCKLFCTDTDDTIIANWGDTVLDGTPCTLGTNNMCIDGICKKVGCDWVIDSKLEEDRCGVCGGNGQQCKPVKEVFNDPLNVTEGYVEIVTIPAKARHIVIKELGNMAHFLAIAKANSSQFFLNGDSLISMPGEFVIAGAESQYDRVDEQENISIPQPIEHSIAIYVIARGNEPNEGIYYEFTLPVVNISNSKRFFWKLSEWSACTVSCGGGLQYREPQCYENGKLTHSDELCWSFAKNSRPTRLTRVCSSQKCPTHWWTGPWQFCPVTCKDVGTTLPSPLRRRTVMCLDQNDIVVNDAMCSDSTRPTDAEPCATHLPACPTSHSISSSGSSSSSSSRDPTMEFIYRVRHL